MSKSAHTLYNERLAEQLWAYRGEAFGAGDGLFEAKYSGPPAPPVFTTGASNRNVLLPDDPALALEVLALVPPAKRHKWFRSMRSSQALALSVFGALKVFGRVGLLAGVRADDDAGPAFGVPSDLQLEHDVTSLKEKRPTSIDVLLHGSTTVCVECKLSEPHVGSCSRTGLRRDHPHWCDGKYHQAERRSGRCVLTATKMAYWDHIPGVFRWPADQDHRPCPLAGSYQLVRNVLAACVGDGRVDANRGHALLLYDARNPAFTPREGGAFEQLRADMPDPKLLRRCSWQSVLGTLAGCYDLKWLVRKVEAKYGLKAGQTAPAGLDAGK